MEKELSLVIPTLNEHENIISLLGQIETVLQGVSHEVLVVDDNSPDGTGTVVEDHSQSHPNVRLIRRLKPAGLSAAVLDGFERAKGAYLGVMDADLSHDPALLQPLLAAMRAGHSMAIGSRKVKGGGADHWPWFRRFYSDVATWLAHVWLRSPVNDPMSGYFVITRGAFERVRPILNPKGYKILLELVTRGQLTDIVEIPYIFKDRKQGHSKLTSRVASQYLSMLWDLRSYCTPMHWIRKTYHTGRYKKVRALLKDGKTLDIGCGQPCETMPEQAFLRFLNRPDSAGLDIKPIEGPFEFHQGSITAMPLKSETFDNVVAMEVFEHVEETDQALKEVGRILKPGGVFVMTTPDCHWLWEWFWSQWTHLIGQMWEHTHVVNLRVPQWVELLSANFNVTEVKRHWRFDIIYRCVKKPG